MAKVIPSDATIRRLVFDLIADTSQDNWHDFSHEAEKFIYHYDSRDIILSILSNIPDDCDELLRLSKHELLVTLFHHANFQSNLIALVSSAYRDIATLFFLHIPKTAGSFLTDNLSKIYPTFTPFDQMRNWTSVHQLFHVIKEKIKRAKQVNSFLIAGHIPLPQALSDGYISHGMRIFTVYRDPLQVYFSHADFVLTSLINDPELKLPHTTRWARTLGLTKQGLSNLINTKQLNVEFYKKVLNIRPGNILCTHLGKGDWQSSISLARHANVELIHISRVNEYLSDNFGIQEIETKKTNSSISFKNKFINDDEISSYVRDCNSEDLTLYSKLEEIRGTVSQPFFYAT